MTFFCYTSYFYSAWIPYVEPSSTPPEVCLVIGGYLVHRRRLSRGAAGLAALASAPAFFFSVFNSLQSILFESIRNFEIWRYDTAMTTDDRQRTTNVEHNHTEI